MCKVSIPNEPQLRDITLPFKEGRTMRGSAHHHCRYQVELTDRQRVTLAISAYTDSSRFWPADTYQPGKAQVPMTSSMYGLPRRNRWNKQRRACLPRKCAADE